MKNTLIAIALIGLLPLSIFGTTPITDGQLQNDLDANGKNINNLEGLRLTPSGTSKIGKAKEIYLAVRTDGIAGSGTALDPLDASTATKYTNILTTYQPNYTFHYAPGTYETYGWMFAARKTAAPGCKHYGAGVDQTIVRLVGASNGPADGVVFGSSYNERADGFELRDMTLDCNATAQPKWTGGAASFVTGINTRGSNIAISKVKVIGFGSALAGTECFPLFVYSNNLVGDFSNNLVENCIITSPATGNHDTGSLLMVGYEGTGSTGTNNVARNNKIDTTGSDFVSTHGVWAQVIEGNYVKGCTSGVYREPPFGGPSLSVIRNNTFDTCSGGIVSSAHVGAITEGFLIENNVFKDCAGAVALSADDSLAHYQEVTVFGNRDRKTDGTISTNRSIHILSADKVVVSNNVLDSSEAHAIYIKATTATVGENRTYAGTLVNYTFNDVDTSQNRALTIGTGSSQAAAGNHTHTLASLGATTIGSNLFGSSNPNIVSFPKIAADNTVSYRTPVQLKSDLSLENVDNTSDANKPVSVAQQAQFGDYHDTTSDTTKLALTGIGAGYKVRITAEGNRIESYIGGTISSDLNWIVLGNFPNFQAHSSSNQTIPNSSWTKMLFQTEDFDTNASHSSSTFTAPRNGYYVFAVFLPHDYANRLIASIWVQSGATQLRIGDTNYLNTRGGGTGTIHMAKGDIAECYVYSYGGDTIHGFEAFWEGSLRP